MNALRHLFGTRLYIRRGPRLYTIYFLTWKLLKRISNNSARPLMLMKSCYLSVLLSWWSHTTMPRNMKMSIVLKRSVILSSNSNWVASRLTSNSNLWSSKIKNSLLSSMNLHLQLILWSSWVTQILNKKPSHWILRLQRTISRVLFKVQFELSFLYWVNKWNLIIYLQ